MCLVNSLNWSQPTQARQLFVGPGQIDKKYQNGYYAKTWLYNFIFEHLLQYLEQIEVYNHTDFQLHIFYYTRFCKFRDGLGFDPQFVLVDEKYATI